EYKLVALRYSQRSRSFSLQPRSFMFQPPAEPDLEETMGQRRGWILLRRQVFFAGLSPACYTSSQRKTHPIDFRFLTSRRPDTHRAILAVVPSNQTDEPRVYGNVSDERSGLSFSLVLRLPTFDFFGTDDFPDLVDDDRKDGRAPFCDEAGTAAEDR